MQIPILNIPRPVPVQTYRTPQANIPQTRGERDRVKEAVIGYVEQVRPVPPLSLEELRNHSEELCRRLNLDPKYRDYLAVVLSNEAWREHLAPVPFERRLLLLPKCLRVEEKCPAPFDEFGLLCKQCGLCSIQDLQEEAERLGYAVLVAEGSAIVMALIQTGKIDAIVGVSCLSVLERAFPYMEAAAIPGIAIPLLQDDCRDTTVDLDWVWDVIHLTSDDRTRRLDLGALKAEVQSWFEPPALDQVFGEPAQGKTEEIAREWLARAGKRWRPFLSICAFKALQEDTDAPLPEDIRRLSIAVECFHKASLIHDDIEDGDDFRYGVKTLHAEHGIPVALNVGDLLLGEGYRLLASSDVAAEIRARMVRIAATGHRSLCQGQGAELCWAQAPHPLNPGQVFELFRQKTSPAFEVALQLGAAYAGAGDEILGVLSQYSEALGIAYQIRDDLDDLETNQAPGDLTAFRPTLPLALAYERTKGENRMLVERAWRRDAALAAEDWRLRALITELGVEERARGLMESYKEQAVRSLVQLKNPSLKGLLRRVVGKIFSMEIKGWCSEFEARNAAGRAARAEGAR